MLPVAALFLLIVASIPPAAEELPPPEETPAVATGGFIGSVSEWLAALALLNQPPDDPDDLPPAPPLPAETYQQVRAALCTLAVEQQIMDVRECGYFLTRSEDFAGYLNILRQRQLELADAPPVEDAGRFPPRATINDYLAFNRSCRQQLDIRQHVRPYCWLEYREAICDTDNLYLVWDTLRDATCDCYYVTVRRRALARLREMLGFADYYAAIMPPWVPPGAFYGDD